MDKCLPSGALRGRRAAHLVRGCAACCDEESGGYGSGGNGWTATLSLLAPPWFGHGAQPYRRSHHMRMPAGRPFTSLRRGIGRVARALLAAVVGVCLRPLPPSGGLGLGAVVEGPVGWWRAEPVSADGGERTPHRPQARQDGGRERRSRAVLLRPDLPPGLWSSLCGVDQCPAHVDDVHHA